MLFQSFWLQWPFKNYTIMFKWLNIKNLITQFIQLYLFFTLCCMSSVPVHLKVKTLCSRRREFLTYPMSSVVVLKLQWIILKPNLISFCSGTVVVFPEYFLWLGVIVNSDIIIKHVFTVWDGYGSSCNDISSCILYIRVLTRIYTCR